MHIYLAPRSCTLYKFMMAGQKKTKLMLEISSSVHLIIGQLYTVFTTTSKCKACGYFFFFFFRMGVYNGSIRSILECSFVIHGNATPIWLQWFVGMDVTSCWDGWKLLTKCEVQNLFSLWTFGFLTDCSQVHFFLNWKQYGLKNFCSTWGWGDKFLKKI